jgi:hypothetical protein
MDFIKVAFHILVLETLPRFSQHIKNIQTSSYFFRMNLELANKHGKTKPLFTSLKKRSKHKGHFFLPCDEIF